MTREEIGEELNRLFLRIPIRDLSHTELGNLKLVQSIFLLIEFTMREPESSSTDKRQHGNDAIVPDQKRIFGQGNESLADGGRKGVLEEEEGGDEGSHVSGCLGKGVLETSDGRENLGDTNENVRDSLHPDVNRGYSLTVVHVTSAVTKVIDVVLGHAGSNHGGAAHVEAGSDPLQGTEVDTQFAQAGVEKLIGQGDEDDQGDGVHVGKNIVGDAIELHSSCLTG
jgi:hypothetical protein